MGRWGTARRRGPATAVTVTAMKSILRATLAGAVAAGVFSALLKRQVARQAAAATVVDGGRPKSWRVARDATHRVVELEMGWTRRIVFSVRHGSERPESVIRHSLLGSRRG